ncbi:type II toxin-antitoxin system HigB family toxin [Niveispirillum cyanobacteriorum]|uniref:Addiction module toxin RelE n=1 Tax=Niveispirillum cyanobacteriorum TaxID=1612173 RepID=A0A2K9NIB9_9PROT|nr:type II toxin-antitoxin system HigB family toxin [Niveispirillum cyanobacteriorum]AUN32813.1 addiction module toxin RelE [Niveispirillum cyanobacteriorum]GGE85546.1 hypothetical protein GCM10011317_48430 [Niveispirillum cyanobacteriorum]
MHILSLRTLKTFWAVHAQAEVPLRAWYAVASKATWTTSADIKDTFGAAVDFVGDNRVVFDISGNKYRLICHVAYKHGKILVKFVGTHADYDKIKDVTTV